MTRRLRVLTLEVRGGGRRDGGEMVEMWPMEVTTDSSRLWKLDGVLATEPMRWRAATNRFDGDRSRVLLSSRVLVRGRVCSRAFLYSVSVAARATKARGLAVRAGWLLCERGLLGGEKGWLAMLSSGIDGASGVTVLMVAARLRSSRRRSGPYAPASDALASLLGRLLWSMVAA